MVQLARKMHFTAVVHQHGANDKTLTLYSHGTLQLPEHSTHELVKWHVFNCFDSSRWSFRYVSGRKTNLTRRTTTWYAMDDIILLHVRIQGKVHCTYTPILPPSGYRQLRNQANRGVCHALETDNPGTSSNPALTICPHLHGYSRGPHTLYYLICTMLTHPLL